MHLRQDLECDYFLSVQKHSETMTPLELKKWRRLNGYSQSQLANELAVAGITEMKQTNAYISNVYMPAFNDEF